MKNLLEVSRETSLFDNEDHLIKYSPVKRMSRKEKMNYSSKDSRNHESSRCKVIFSPHSVQGSECRDYSVSPLNKKNDELIPTTIAIASRDRINGKRDEEREKEENNVGVTETGITVRKNVTFVKPTHDISHIESLYASESLSLYNINTNTNTSFSFDDPDFEVFLQHERNATKGFGIVEEVADAISLVSKNICSDLDQFRAENFESIKPAYFLDLGFFEARDIENASRKEGTNDEVYNSSGENDECKRNTSEPSHILDATSQGFPPTPGVVDASQEDEKSVQNSPLRATVMLQTTNEVSQVADDGKGDTNLVTISLQCVEKKTIVTTDSIEIFDKSYIKDEKNLEDGDDINDCVNDDNMENLLRAMVTLKTSLERYDKATKSKHDKESADDKHCVDFEAVETLHECDKVENNTTETATNSLPYLVTNEVEENNTTEKATNPLPYLVTNEVEDRMQLGFGSFQLENTMVETATNPQPIVNNEVVDGIKLGLASLQSTLKHCARPAAVFSVISLEDENVENAPYSPSSLVYDDNVVEC